MHIVVLLIVYWPMAMMARHAKKLFFYLLISLIALESFEDVQEAVFVVVNSAVQNDDI